MMLTELKGVVRLNDLNEIEESTGLVGNIEALKEDLLQVVYFGQIILDVGFYPEFDLLGEFVVLVIKDEDWSAPVLTIKSRNLSHLEPIIMLAEEFIVVNLNKQNNIRELL